MKIQLFAIFNLLLFFNSICMDSEFEPGSLAYFIEQVRRDELDLGDQVLDLPLLPDALDLGLHLDPLDLSQTQDLHSSIACHRMHKRNKFLKSRIPDSEFSQSDEIHCVQHKRRSIRIQCSSCPTVVNKCCLSKHLQTHALETPFQNEATLRAREHERDNESIGSSDLSVPHTCKKYSRKIHICKICNKEFSKATSLRDHLMSYYKIKPYICSECDYTCVQKSNLITHIKANHPLIYIEKSISYSKTMPSPKSPDKPYKCQAKDCEKSYPQKNDLNSHIKKKHPEIYAKSLMEEHARKETEQKIIALLKKNQAKSQS